MFERDTGIFVSILAVALLVLVMQLLLCFKAKKPLLQRAPIVVLAVANLVLFLLMRFSRTWAAFAYAILYAASGAMLLFDGFAWVIWAIDRSMKQKKKA
ncbi:MAG: hypothetical protein E7449_05380 [Ruminococcaceae bacterium]|nr:hypothetical protein [Oscillospiraceae bacterium]